MIAFQTSSCTSFCHVSVEVGYSHLSLRVQTVLSAALDRGGGGVLMSTLRRGNVAIDLLPVVTSGVHYHGKGVFLAMNYFSNHIYCSIWSFDRAFINLLLELGHR